MRLHERYFAVQHAENELHAAFYGWLEAHPDLTHLEVLKALTGLLSDTTRYALRTERHPADDCDHKGDEACENPACNEVEEPL